MKIQFKANAILKFKCGTHILPEDILAKQWFKSFCEDSDSEDLDFLKDSLITIISCDVDDDNNSALFQIEVLERNYELSFSTYQINDECGSTFVALDYIKELN